jgi:adenylate kinase
MKVVILLGAPGSGKGTTAERIRDAAHLIHVSTGDMLRESVKKGTEIGREAETYMKRGALAPDSVIIKLVEARLDAGHAEDAYLFDGFPRTIPQAELLEKSLAGRRGAIAHVIFLDAPRKVLIERLTGRRTCRKCGANYHIRNIPPKKEGVCDACGGELYQRPDDREETIVHRLDVYNKETEGLISRYEKQGLLKRVDSSQEASRLASEVQRILETVAIKSGKR